MQRRRDFLRRIVGFVPAGLLAVTASRATSTTVPVMLTPGGFVARKGQPLTFPKLTYLRRDQLVTMARIIQTSLDKVLLRAGTRGVGQMFVDDCLHRQGRFGVYAFCEADDGKDYGTSVDIMRKEVRTVRLVDYDTTVADQEARDFAQYVNSVWAKGERI